MSKVADNWHPQWYEMLYEQEGLCKMEQCKVTGSGDRWSVDDGKTIIANCFTEANAERICKCVNGWDELQARLETAERLVLQGGAGHDAIVKKAVELQKQRDALLMALKAKVVKCCDTCDSFGFNKVFQYANDGRCPFDSKGHRKTDCCEKWNIDAIAEAEK